MDGISNNLIKTAKYVFAKPLTLIINQMLYSGIFPEQLKVSKIIPLHKANDKLQYGFRTKHSTELAALNLVGSFDI